MCYELKHSTQHMVHCGYELLKEVPMLYSHVNFQFHTLYRTGELADFGALMVVLNSLECQLDRCSWLRHLCGYNGFQRLFLHTQVVFWRCLGMYFSPSLVPRPPRPAFVACSTKSGGKAW